MINETDTKKGNSMDLNRQLIEAMADLNEDLVISTVRQMAAEGHSFEEIQQCLNTGISAVGTRFERGDYFIADLIVSGMIYRMKQNAVGLANVAILSTMVLVMIFSTFSLWFGMDDSLRSHCPTQLVFEITSPIDVVARAQKERSQHGQQPVGLWLPLADLTAPQEFDGLRQMNLADGVEQDQQEDHADDQRRAGYHAGKNLEGKA